MEHRLSGSKRRIDVKKGLLMVNTGNGKGKTTAALGLMFRAMGHGFRVCLIQFIKGTWKYGELTSTKRFADLLDVQVLGKGFTWKTDDKQVHIEAGRKAWEVAKEAIGSGKYRLVVLDELTYLMKYQMVPEEHVVDFLKNRPEGLHVMVTGRDAPQSLIDAADLVTEMLEIRHPYQQGIPAQRGIEF
jgi:cob(I)alamin adenosyltransferase